MLARLTAGQRDGAIAAKQMMTSEGGWKLRSYFSHQWTKVHEILGQCKGPFVVSSAVSWVSISCSSPEILALKFATELWICQK